MMLILEHSLGGWLIDRLTHVIPGDFILIKHWCVLIYGSVRSANMLKRVLTDLCQVFFIQHFIKTKLFN